MFQHVTVHPRHLPRFKKKDLATKSGIFATSNFSSKSNVFSSSGDHEFSQVFGPQIPCKQNWNSDSRQSPKGSGLEKLRLEKNEEGRSVMGTGR